MTTERGYGLRIVDGLPAPFPSLLTFLQFVKCGFAGAQFPTSIFPSMVGRPQLRYEEKVEGIEIKDIMVGDEAALARHMLKVSYPVENGAT